MTGANAARVHICNYGIGNIHSVIRAFEHLGAECVNCTDPSMLEHVERLVIPGVGAFASCIQAFQGAGFEQPVRRIIDGGRPVLGICVGMQMLADFSEEFGEHRGIGVIPGRVRMIPTVTTHGEQLPVPHISWSGLRPGGASWEETPFDRLREGDEVYFVHSYYFDCERSADQLAQFEYGGHALTAAVMKENVLGVQFHPEKSSGPGLSILSRFISQ